MQPRHVSEARSVCIERLLQVLERILQVLKQEMQEMQEMQALEALKQQMHKVTMNHHENGAYLYEWSYQAPTERAHARGRSFPSPPVSRRAQVGPRIQLLS